MKQIFLAFLLFFCACTQQRQPESISFSIENGEIRINASEQDIKQLKAGGFVRYSVFGAVGDGKTDDIDAIAATHAFANEHGLMVKADEGATYYISGKVRTAVIQTDTGFGTAAFIIDDTEVEDRTASVFLVSSSLQPFDVEGLIDHQGKLLRYPHRVVDTRPR